MILPLCQRLAPPFLSQLQAEQPEQQTGLGNPQIIFSPFGFMYPGWQGAPPGRIFQRSWGSQNEEETLFLPFVYQACPLETQFREKVFAALVY
jgi:hypothetical protein